MRKFDILLITIFSFAVILGLAGELKAQPDLFIREFTLSPSEPTKGQPVDVRVNVYNRGNRPAGPFTVEWWPGENYTAPGCTWRVDSLAARGGRILTCRYEGYPSW